MLIRNANCLAFYAEKCLIAAALRGDNSFWCIGMRVLLSPRSFVARRLPPAEFLIKAATECEHGITIRETTGYCRMRTLMKI